MREELIINGQHVDLSGNSGITLEYVSNLLNDPGKISLSHSYTIKLPRTVNNARILDLPEVPAHESAMTRRYLPAQYYRNGINLIGDNAQAYITSATDEQYELVLVWDDIPELRALAESEATINDLRGLPVMTWVGNSYGAGNAEAVFAKYTSSNVPKNTTNVNDLIHPCMGMSGLMSRVLQGAGVTFTRPPYALQYLMVLAAPSHKPDWNMNLNAGVSVLGRDESANREVYFLQDTATTAILTTSGVGSVQASPAGVPAINRYTMFVELPDDYRSCHVVVRIKTQSDADLSDCVLRVHPVSPSGGSWTHKLSVVLGEIPFVKEPVGYACVGDLYIELPEGVTQFAFVVHSPTAKNIGTYAYAYGTGNPYILRAFVERERIDTSFENTFPLEGNLPDIKQWDFLRNCMLIGGLIPVVSQSALHLYDVAYFGDITRALDWTKKLTASDDIKIRPTVSSEWAQINRFTFAKNPDLKDDRGFALSIQDETLKPSRDWASLDFAASVFDYAMHYKSTDEGATYEDVDIEPRFFKYDRSNYSLQFTPDLYGEGLKAKYAALQDALAHPVVIEAQVRLSEIDLATLDITRPVYLAQFGRYYHVLKVQTSDTDLCKVELLQLK